MHILRLSALLLLIGAGGWLWTLSGVGLAVAALFAMCALVVLVGAW